LKLETQDIRSILDRLYSAESRRILASLIRLLGDFDLAEDALQYAFAVAAEQWPRDGPQAGLEIIDAIIARGDLVKYHLAHSARAELCRRLGKTAEARASFEQALILTQQAPERRFLEAKLREMG
jgi:predicted RNA polymerase sigma factor